MRATVVAKFLALFISFSLVACSTIPYTIRTSDPRARILVDGQVVGQGTAIAELKRNRDHAVLAETPDGRAASGQIGHCLDALGRTAVATCWIMGFPLLLLLLPESYRLTPETLAIALPPPAAAATEHAVGR